jgi:hypothetical protein
MEVNGAGVTITLPTPTAGAQVTIENGLGTAASPTTVSSSSANIYGVGSNGVSSFVLGTARATVTLVADGGAWLCMPGSVQDTGYVALTLNAGWAAQSGYFAPAYRLLGGRVSLRGAATYNSGVANQPLATFPASIRPALQVGVSASQGGAAGYSPLTLTVTAGGGSSFGANVSVGNWGAFDNGWYDLA